MVICFSQVSFSNPRWNASIISRLLSLCILILSLLSLLQSNIVLAETQAQPVEFIHFLIPGGEGGGWDTTAREAGKALLASRLVHRVYFDNFIGAGGGRALMALVNHPEKHLNTWMIQSTPLILRHLTGTIPYSFRDIIPIGTLIAEYQAIVVPMNSRFHTIHDLISAIADSPVRNPILGGSSLGSLDHITLALIAQAGDLPISKLRYVPTDGGGDAIKKLNQGLGVALVSGIGEVTQAYRNQEIRILGVTSKKRLVTLPKVKTLSEQGLNVQFANWRGFFVSSQLSAEKVQSYKQLLSELNLSQEWATARKTHQWQQLFLQDDDLIDFLNQQELMMKKALSDLEIE
ncbi:tripartite tricarboxylate transporter substrate-binding protein [Shewanella violacea]|uniref:Bordetella uptake gene family protein n=1 Tax=Shewanella violacea (strain JCM 10179 / CIP 106290 / LMG 19151 / DSS12) TaxID=637905 RepID=D4ZLX7_SHEVD|nr:tripartite tricarboxylate transporter substrate-binding protein [Shewanella violacea]BAJ02676.1 conserved hypothetical protein [Shewanella violacea DSS12]